jgi:ATP-dependent DNA helicase DinG
MGVGVPARIETHVTENSKASQILSEAVRVITGLDDAAARPSQYRLMESINETMHGMGPTIGKAATGTGKSLAYLAPAAAAAMGGERTVISTESLALQAQIVDKDGPVIQEACRRITPERPWSPNIAVLKGFSNYVCLHAAHTSAKELLGQDTFVSSSSVGDQETGLVSKTAKQLRAKPTSHSGNLVAWALEQGVQGNSGDKFTYPDRIEDDAWEKVSVASTDCIGAEKCPFSDQCLALKSRSVAASADIVVTNHTMIGLQASKGVPVVIGSKTLGDFHNIVIDEAHGLPGVVRNQGSAMVSGIRFHAAAKAVGSFFVEDPQDAKGGKEGPIAALVRQGKDIGDLVESTLATHTASIKPGDVKALEEDANPLAGIGPSLVRWVKNVKDMIEDAESDSATNEITRRRLESRFSDLSNSIKECSEHRVGTARWIEISKPKKEGDTAWSTIRFTPVDVSWLLRDQVWSTPDMDVPDIATNPDYRVDGKLQIDRLPRRWLNIAAVSATLQNSFDRDVGLKAPVGIYESPFTEAFSRSAMFVPRAMDKVDVDALCGPGASLLKKPKLNTRLHPDWASAIMRRLVEANGGHALVLSATASAGQKYAAELRSASMGRWKVISQWDGMSIRHATDSWKQDPSAVLVGTRSLMTGVDAPGSTNTLVIVDRIPRAAGNPVDDARVEQLIVDADFDKWSADRIVYGGDATLLLEQAAGRLIRSVGDSGMVAVLDPRLLRENKGSRVSYPKATRDLYLSALEAFDKKISDHDKAAEWLREHRKAVS